MANEEDEELEKLRQEHIVLSHAMQAGVAFCQKNNFTDECSAKHLRVGLNVTMSDQGGLVALLVQKGVITEKEYFETIVETMRQEVAAYEKRIEIATGQSVRLLGMNRVG